MYIEELKFGYDIINTNDTENSLCLYVTHIQHRRKKLHIGIVFVIASHRKA